MNYQVHIQTDPGFNENNEKLIEAVIAVLDYDKAESGAVTIVLTSNEYVHQLNLRYLKRDMPTDVLSFPDGDVDPETQKIYYGDVVIAVPIALDNAKRGRHPLEAELMLLVVHGVLHLLGYNHINDKNRDRMWAAQTEILRHLNCEIEGPIKSL